MLGAGVARQWQWQCTAATVVSPLLLASASVHGEGRECLLACKRAGPASLACLSLRHCSSADARPEAVQSQGCASAPLSSERRKEQHSSHSLSVARPRRCHTQSAA